MRLSPKFIFLTFALTLLEFSQPKLPRDMKILCWIPTDPIYHENRSLHVKNTWGKRCDHLLFFSTGYDEILPSIVVETSPGWAFLWEKVRTSMKIIYEKHLNEADWFLKADDDTYVIIENLKYLLKDYDPSKAIAFGSPFKSNFKNYMNGGAGYVLSRTAVKNLVEVAFKNPNTCSASAQRHEDYEMGLCLEAAGVTFGDSLDEFGRDRFFPLSIDHHTQPYVAKGEEWAWKESLNFPFPGIPNCSKKPISFHKVSAGFMYAFEYLIYHVKVMSRNLTKF